MEIQVGIEERFPSVSAGSYMVNSIRVPNAPSSRNGYHLLSVVHLFYYED